ncbi:hypothetical protein H2200_003514 [Cladophialophora chaetospira]|uniref:F-box domain-containing protein n=1 Tax=Cladophialophora chaetospira TaxID=386627 RepID=A0AA38XHM3_9EURO|nr:hypothetical protein H2200_003514 [Cladophialophora chaetospira]
MGPGVNKFKRRGPRVLASFPPDKTESLNGAREVSRTKSWINKFKRKGPRVLATFPDESFDLARHLHSLGIDGHEADSSNTPSQPHCPQPPPREPPTLLNLPLEIRRMILRELRSFDKTIAIEEKWKDAKVAGYYNPAQPLPRQRTPATQVAFMLSDGRDTMIKTDLHVSALRCCKQLYYEGRHILRYENHFIGVDGFKSYDPIQTLLRIWGQVPFWDISQMKKIYRTPEFFVRRPELNMRFPELNIILRISNGVPTPTPGMVPNSSKVLLFPLICLELVCKVISCLPTVPGFVHHTHRPQPRCWLLFKDNLSARTLSRGHRDPKAFMTVLAQSLIDSLGKSIIGIKTAKYHSPEHFNQRFQANIARYPPPGCSEHEFQPFGSLTSSFMDQLRLRNTEGPQAALTRALIRLSKEWKEGERLAMRGADTTPARNHFSNMKQMICLISHDAYWRSLISANLKDRLTKAYHWACLRIATIPIMNEAKHMQAFVATETARLEALWAMAHLIDGTPPSRVGPAGWERQARLHLRKSELEYMTERTYWKMARSLVYATCFLAPPEMYDHVVNVVAKPEIPMWVAKFIWGSEPSTSEDIDIHRLMGAVEDDAFWLKSWNRMRGGRTEDNELMDRECFIEKWAKVKELVGRRFGRVGKCPYDPDMLLEGISS